MLKRQPVKIIAIFSFALSIMGIINDLFITTHDFEIIKIKDALNPLNLGFVFEGHLFAYNGHNYVNAIFDILLLVGAILYVTSKNTESRLVRFVFSVILFSNIILFAAVALLFIFNPFYPTIWLHDLPFRLLDYAMSIFWIYLSFNILKFFNHRIPLQADMFEENGQSKSFLVPAGSGKRFLHLIADAVTLNFLFYPVSEILFYNHHRFSDSLAIVWLIAIFKTLGYYLFYEAVLSATPAKFLTGTRVLDYDGSSPSFKKVLARTFLRLVPFEAFSFLSGDNWHDKWSETLVAKEDKMV